jgi:NAD(P)-dependent dehydrogenase (short-subunit alcohol dehydrogenase family)
MRCRIAAELSRPGSGLVPWPCPSTADPGSVRDLFNASSGPQAWTPWWPTPGDGRRADRHGQPALIERVRHQHLRTAVLQQYASRLMARGGGGSIIALSSSSRARPCRQSVYAGSKAAVLGPWVIDGGMSL